MASASSIVFDIIGRDHASATFDKINKSTEQTTSKLQKFQKVGAVAGKALAGGLALAGAAALSATQAAAEDQQGAEKLAQSLRTAAGATDAQVASTEAWITKQGQALGVADDDLRPALAKLATATGSVSKAQSLASLAMNVSAATGKSLSSVTQSLARAQTGSVAGLSKYGIATKDAQGHTLSLADATDALSKKYAGAASSAADTAAGKQKILTVQLGELREQIGYQLLPVLTKLATNGLKVVNFLSQNATTVEVLVGAFGGLLAVTAAVSAVTGVYAAVTGAAAAETLVQKAAVLAVNVATKAYAAGQWLLNAALTANPIGLVVVAIAALVAGLVLAYQHSETFRNIVNAAFSAVSGVVLTAVNAIGAAVGWVTDFVRNHFALFVTIVAGPVGLAVLEVIKHWDAVKAATSAVWNAIKSAVSTAIHGVISAVNGIAKIVETVRNAWDAAKTAVTNKVGDIVSFVKGLPGKVVSALSGLASDLKSTFGGAMGDALSKIQDKGGDIISWFKKLPGKIIDALSGIAGQMIEVGKNIVRGIASGISAGWSIMADAVQAFKEHLVSEIKSKLGINSPSKVMHPYGRSITEGLAKGMADAAPEMDKSTKKVLDRLKSKLASVKDARSSLADSVSGALSGNLFGASATDATTDENGNVTSPAQSALQNFMASLAKQRSDVSADKSAIGTLKGWGLSSDFISNLAQSGNSALIQQLAQDKGSASLAANQFGSINKDAASIGLSVGNDVYGNRISSLDAQINKIDGKGSKGSSDQAPAGDTYNFTFNGDTLDSDVVMAKVEAGLAKAKRKRGGRRLAFES